MYNFGSMQKWGMGQAGMPGLDQEVADLSGLGSGYAGNPSWAGAAGIPAIQGLPPMGPAQGGMFSGILDNFRADNFMGTPQAPGWGGMAFDAMGGIGKLFMGMKQYGLAKKALAQGKDQFERQYTAQQTLTNGQLEDRQRARVSSNPGAYESVGNYMDKNRIK